MAAPRLLPAFASMLRARLAACPWHSRASRLARQAGAVALLVGSGALLSGCECSSDATGRSRADSGLTDAAPDVTSTGGASGTGGTAGSGGATADASPPDASNDAADARFADSAPDSAASDAAPPPLDAPDAPPPVSVYCGDGIRGLDEECDDGNADETDLCTHLCRVQDGLALAPVTAPPYPYTLREIARGPHPAAASPDGAAVLFVDEATSPARLGVALFRKDGTRVSPDGFLVDDGRNIYGKGDASVVALPGNRYAVAFGANTSTANREIFLRTVDGATGALGAVQVVNQQSTGNQEDVDLVWTGSELVVAWTDDGDSSGPHVRVRRYDASSSPLAGEEAGAPGHDGDAFPVLARHAADWALTWIERDSQGNAAYGVRSANAEWRVSGFYNVTGDAPVLTSLDDGHLFLVVGAPVWVADAGLDLPRLFGAVLDEAAPGDTNPSPIEPRTPPFDDRSQMHTPAVTFSGGSVYLSWLMGPWLGASYSDQLVLKVLPWGSGDGGAPVLDFSVPEIPLARDTARQYARQVHPALAATREGAGGSLFAAWQDDGRTFGVGEHTMDVVVESIPLPLLREEPADGGTTRDQ